MKCDGVCNAHNARIRVDAPFQQGEHYHAGVTRNVNNYCARVAGVLVEIKLSTFDDNTDFEDAE